MDSKEWAWWELEQILETIFDQWKADGGLDDFDSLIVLKRQELADQMYKIKELHSGKR